jgi:ribosomal protein S12 methylthiotransferase
MKSLTFNLISLGCAKNSVDSDSIIQLLEQDGYKYVKRSKNSDILIVNTCGFIESARNESYSVLRKLAATKRPDQMLIAAGCLSQRYGEEVAKKVPGLDGILGTRRWMDVVSLVQRLRKRTVPPFTPESHPEPIIHNSKISKINTNEMEVLQASISGGSAYLKIADGCRRLCAFCAIPLIKSLAVSRPMDEIVRDARRLRDLGIREIILIAQDTTDYGHDLGIDDGLSILLEKIIAAVPDVDWIRIMYSFPGCVTDRLIEVMANHPQILPYLDIPLQHASPAILLKMHRPTNVDWVHTTIAKMRSKLPGLAIRTTFIVGYPGETEEEFKELLEFIDDLRFDHVGVFEFSFEKGTDSESLGDKKTGKVKRSRFRRLMEHQQTISLQINQSYVGHTMDVLIEGWNKGISIGRTYRDAPEIDGLVLVEGKAEIGTIIPVLITGAMAYDLTGIPLKDS